MMKRKTGKIIRWTIGIILFIAALTKIIGLPPMPSMFQNWGIFQFMIIIGLLELIIAALYLTQKTLAVGAFLISAYLGGAIITHLIHSEFLFIIPPSIILVGMFISLYLERPKTLI